VLEAELKSLILSELKIKDVRAEDLTDEESLFEGQLGLDSLDAIELVMVMKKHYDINIRDRNEARECFASVRTMADYIRAHPSN